MVAIRDLKCMMDIAEMAALGKFEQEFIVYGCCYVEDDQIFYRISSRAEEIYAFIDQCLQKGIYPSPVQQLLHRILVPSGMQEEYLYQTKILLARQMQRQYPSGLLHRFAALAKADGNDCAAERLYLLKRQLIGCFDRDLLKLVQGIIIYAFRQKKLKGQTYEAFQQWLDDVYQQMEDDVVLKKPFLRTFYGFAYKNTQQKTCYVINAKQSEVRKRQEMLQCSGILSTPVAWRTYYDDAQPDLRVVKHQFQRQLEQWLSKEYWQILQQIDQLPAAMEEDLFQQLEAEASQKNLDDMLQYLQYYHCLWCSL